MSEVKIEWDGSYDYTVTQQIVVPFGAKAPIEIRDEMPFHIVDSEAVKPGWVLGFGEGVIAVNHLGEWLTVPLDEIRASLAGRHNDEIAALLASVRSEQP